MTQWSSFAVRFLHPLTQWDEVTHICVSKLNISGPDNGLPPGRHQAIIWTNAGILSIGHLGTNCSEILIEISIYSFRKMHLKMSYLKLAATLSWLQCVNHIWAVLSSQKHYNEFALRITDITLVIEIVSRGRQVLDYSQFHWSHCMNQVISEYFSIITRKVIAMQLTRDLLGTHILHAKVKVYSFV